MTTEELFRQIEALGFVRTGGDWRCPLYRTEDYNGKGAVEIAVERHYLRVLWIQKSGISYTSEYDMWMIKECAHLAPFIDQHITKWEEYIKKEASH